MASDDPRPGPGPSETHAHTERRPGDEQAHPRHGVGGGHHNGHGEEDHGHPAGVHHDAGHGHPHAAVGRHDHEHGVGGHGHDHPRGGHRHGGLLSVFRPGHSHDAADRVDAALEGSDRPGRVLAVSFVALAVTAVVEGIVTSFSGSVALLGDSLHNAADALTAVPLWVAFSLGRRSPTQRYTYGYGRAEDLAGIAIVLAMAVSTGAALWESVRHLVHPSTVHNLPAVMLAAAVGVAGNEGVAAYRIRAGRRIGSAALTADGYHARSDGLTSLAVLVGAGVVALGWRRADPVVGVVVSLAILFVLRAAALDIYHRLMDAVDPYLVDQVQQVLRAVPGVVSVADVRVRWVGHRLSAEASVGVDGGMTVAAGHDLLEGAHHSLLHEVPKLSAAVLHADPAGALDAHGVTAHHRSPTPGERQRGEQ